VRPVDQRQPVRPTPANAGGGALLVRAATSMQPTCSLLWPWRWPAASSVSASVGRSTGTIQRHLPRHLRAHMRPGRHAGRRWRQIGSPVPPACVMAVHRSVPRSARRRYGRLREVMNPARPYDLASSPRTNQCGDGHGRDQSRADHRTPGRPEVAAVAMPRAWVGAARVVSCLRGSGLDQLPVLPALAAVGSVPRPPACEPPPCAWLR
jgi:hypothetical protein